jgi:trigger factor
MSANEASDTSAVRVQTSEESSVLRKLAVEVDAKRVKRAFDRAYRELAKSVAVKGFRPGKAPRSVLERLYGASVAERIERTLVAETLSDAIEQTGLEPVAEPAVEAATLLAGEDFCYTARVEVKPEIELPDLTGLPAKKPRVEVADEEIEREIEALRQRNAPVIEEPEGTLLASGHIATLDFVGRIEGKPFQGGSGQGVDLEIGSGQFIPGFEEQLVGAVSGEDREVTVHFPEEYANAELAGKEAVFAAHVVAVKRRELPALDDDFAKDLGDFETLEDLRARIRADITAAREQAAKAELQRTLLESLVERASFDVPPGMIERQLQQQLHTAREQLEARVPEEELLGQLERWKEQWRESAERKVREGLLLQAVTQAEGLSVSPQEIEARIQEMAAQQGVDPGRLRKTFGGEVFERALEAQMADEKALDFLAARAKVEETTGT